MNPESLHPPVISRPARLSHPFIPGGLRALLAGCAALTPVLASAANWTGTTGPFSTAANWSGGAVPNGASALITNNGIATVAAGDSFSVTTLSLGDLSGRGTLTQSGGNITATTQVMIGGTDSYGGSGNGTCTISGGTLTSSSGNEFWVGTRGGTGTLTLSGSALVTASGTTNIGRDTGGNGTLIIRDQAELRTTANDINVGVANGGATSSITVQNYGKITCGREVTVGLFGQSPTKGTLTLRDQASLSTVLAVVIGKLDAARGSMIVSDQATVTTGTYVVIGADSGSAAGDLTLNGNATVNSGQQLIMGVGGSTSTLTMNGGVFRARSHQGEDLNAGVTFRGGSSTINLNGGTLETPGMVKSSGAVAAVKLNGGIIKVTGAPSSGEFFNGFTTGDLVIQSGGLTMDTNGIDARTSQTLTGTGGLTKTGAGTLFLNGSNSYSGSTSVTAGTLGGTGSLAGSVTVASGGTIDPGDGTGTLTTGPASIAGTYACEVDGSFCDKLAVNGALDVSGATLNILQLSAPTAPVLVIASYTGSTPAPFAAVQGLPAGYSLDYHYNGSNRIALVQSGGSAYGGWIAGYFPNSTDPAVIGPDADPDRDGISNSVEFALGGRPDRADSRPLESFAKTSRNDGSDAAAGVLTIAVRSGTPDFSGSPAPSATRDGFTYTVAGSRDLSSFPSTPVAQAGTTLVTALPAAPENYEYRSFRFIDSGAGTANKGFMQVNVAAYTGEDLTLGDFDGATYGNWTADGAAFAGGPASGAELTTLEIENAHGGVATSERQGDGPVGTLTSPEFKISRAYISFSTGGGDYEHHTCLNLLVDGQVVKSATGRFSDRLVDASWDVRPWAGKNARIQIVDQASGGWGHINVGKILQTDAPEVPPINKGALYHEAPRPQLHFTAKQHIMDRLNPGMRQDGWLNDLNGMVYYEGEYHLFAQRWNKCWIHAVSTDLLHWKELDPAFWEESLDSGVQSGSCVIDYGNTSGLSPDPANPPMVAIWSRNDNRTHCLSYSLDRGRTWQHYAQNPVLVFPERDPKIFWHAPTSRWVMVMYGSSQYHIFTSTDLKNWHNENHPIPNAYECPDFFEMPVEGSPGTKKWALIHADGTYSLGSFTGTQFTEETARFLCDVGGENFYATQSFNNTDKADGRRIQLAWMRGSNFPNMPFSQQVSFPCEMTLHQTPAGLRIFRKPVRELDQLEQATGGQNWANTSLAAGSELNLASNGELYRIKAQVSIPAGAKLTFNLRGYNLVLTSNSLDGGTGAKPTQGQVQNVEILVDRASVESFINDGEISCTRYFQPSQTGFSVKAEGGNVTVSSMSIRPLKSIWEGQ